jgi:Xaa-Pro dipeptidase
MATVTRLAPHLQRILDSEYPRFSEIEMARRRTALEPALAEAGVDHLIVYGANRAGSGVQWLTQWPVTTEAACVFTPGRSDALFVQYVNHAPLARILADRAEVAWGGESTIRMAIAALEKRGARPDRIGLIGPLGASAR